MKKPRTILIKNLHYLCLVGVIALGLITIVGSNGGGGDGGTSTTTTGTTTDNTTDNTDPTPTIIDSTAPEDVTSLSAQPGDTKVTLSWTTSANSEGDLARQKVYYSSDGGTTYTTAESALDASATRYGVTGLTNGTCYMFKVTCYDEVPNESSGATVSCIPTNPGDFTILDNSNFPVQSGLTDGGIAKTDTQTMTGTVSNPTCWSDTYGGEAYLAVNGDRIPLDLTQSVGGSGWTFTVTFSVNAGPNTIRIEVYDLNDVLFAATEEWSIIGTIEPSSETNIYDIILGDPELTNFPDVALTLTGTDPNNNDEHVSGLTSDNFYVINAGTIMSDVTVTEGSSSYTLEYTDITSGKRDLYVYVYVPSEGDTPRKGGLSNTKTYGTNYALLVGLNEYPAAYATPSNWDTSNYTIDVEPSPPAGTASVDADEFTIEFYIGNTLDASVTATSIASQGGGVYRLGYPSRDHSNHTTAAVKYEKEAWLSNCLNDIVDLEAALKDKANVQATSRATMDNSAWLDANIHTLTNSGATETAITSKISTIASGMQKYDLFLFHFSGHGSGDSAAGDASQYLCAYEDDSWISVTDLSNALDDIPQPGTSSYITNVFVLLDACHSGNFIGKGMQGSFVAGVDRARIQRFRPFMPQREEVPSGYRSLTFSRDLQDMTNKNHVFVMTAAAGDESSWDDPILENGVFTFYLVEGITVTGKYISATAANTNNDTWITGEEAFTYLDAKANAWVSTANGYPADAVQDAQLQDNSTTTSSRFIYNW